MYDSALGTVVQFHKPMPHLVGMLSLLCGSLDQPDYLYLRREPALNLQQQANLPHFTARMLSEGSKSAHEVQKYPCRVCFGWSQANLIAGQLLCHHLFWRLSADLVCHTPTAVPAGYIASSAARQER